MHVLLAALKAARIPPDKDGVDHISAWGPVRSARHVLNAQLPTAVWSGGTTPIANTRVRMRARPHPHTANANAFRR